MSTSIIPITIITLLSLFSVSLVNIIGSSTTYAEGSSVSLSIDNSDTVLELTVPSSVSLDLTPSSTNNYNPSGTANLAISAGTNNITGYTLTMSVPNTNLTNSGITLTSSNNPNNIPLDSSNHPIIPTIASTYSGSNFPDNAWGYRLSTSANYSPVPSSIELASTNSAGNATTTTIELAAKVNSAQPAGTYTTTFNIAATAKQSVFTVNWNANDGTVSPTTSTYRYGSQIGTLPTPTYTGYDFLGWFTQATGGEQISETTTVTTDVTYWAQWKKATVTFDKAFTDANKSKATAADGNEYYRMQDMTADICSAVSAPDSTATADTQITTLVDDRGDKKTYTVAKLLDGNCWMTENLRLGGSSAIILTNSDSNVSSDFVLPAHRSNWTWTYTAAIIHVSDDMDDVTSQYYGYYYNYYAASAGTVKDTQVTATSSICPKGWTLPSDYSGTQNKSLANLLIQQGVISNVLPSAGSSTSYLADGWDKMKTAPLNFARSGFHDFSSSTIYARGSDGAYWSDASYSTAGAYSLRFYSSGVDPQSRNYNKGHGLVVRCVAE